MVEKRIGTRLAPPMMMLGVTENAAGACRNAPNGGDQVTGPKVPESLGRELLLLLRRRPVAPKRPCDTLTHRMSLIPWRKYHNRL